MGNFAGGFYVRIDDSIFAVVGPRIWPGPIHLVLDSNPPPVVDGAAVYLDPRRLTFSEGTIDIASASVYVPRTPPARELGIAAPWMTFWAAAEQRPNDLGATWHDVQAATENGDLEGAAAVLEGRGTGLTPSGDDALAGLLLFYHWTGWRPARLTAIATRARTTDLSRNFLRWAARGQSIAPVHMLFSDSGDALCPSAPQRRGEFEQAAHIVRGIGHCSGAALLAGLGLAAAAWKSDGSDDS
ncbi:DUF2877 domain-containing protein [Sphingobium sp. LB126]|uniref:oxamate carbamoyltransferase subunit AllH family protein n=1 Tax=Sphingobium sp. LB126 TaxID=1983755 RepID=UPI0018D57D3C|nr:DUF2877 domain-containing protein [Sphingobium sp. LB126]